MSSIYDTLNDMQKEAVFHTEGPLLILAGAGSGKTRVLTHRVAYLIEEKGVQPWNIMAITFTNKAAGEMKERVQNLVGFGSDQIWVSTFHSSCVRILRRYIDRLGYENHFTIYDTDDQKSLMKDVFKRLNVDTKVYKERNILAQISKAKNDFISPEQYAIDNQGDFSKKKVIECYKLYQEQLKNNNALDFDDLLVKTVELFENNKDVLEYYRERFKYIMVDEYQDTNTVQFKFISMLAKEHRNLCVVGDDDQSIYKFRGANIKNILNFESVFTDAHVIKLEQNYRSTQNILNAANEMIKNNTERKSKTLWTDRGDGEKITFKMVDFAQQEAEYVAESIEKYVENGKTFKECACLYRTNAQSRLLEEALMRKNIPYKIVGGINFYQRKEIKDILAYLKTVNNGVDDLAVRRIINVPKRGIGAASIDKIQEYADSRGISFYDAARDEKCLEYIGRSSAKVKSFVDLIQVLRTKNEFINVRELIDEITDVTGYVRELEAENTDESKERIANIEELLTKAVDYQLKAEKPSLNGFLEEVALVADIDSLDPESDYVVLMTVHSSKGLEFPNVYLCGMEDGLFPSYMSISSDDPLDIEEERRLCYVAITRAMDNLHISCAKQRMVRGEIQYGKMSRFLKEIPLELLDTGMKKAEPTEKRRVTRPTQASSARQIINSKAFEPRQFKVTKLTGLEYGAGDRVKHIKFGEGTVVSVAEGGRDFEVTVNFDKVGVKKMFASFAKLKKI